MSIQTQQRYPVTAEWLALRSACQKQGRKIYWVAAQADMAYKTLYCKMNGYEGYTWRSGEREAIIAALAIEPTEIWPDWTPEQPDT